MKNAKTSKFDKWFSSTSETPMEEGQELDHLINTWKEELILDTMAAFDAIDANKALNTVMKKAQERPKNIISLRHCLRYAAVIVFAISMGYALTYLLQPTKINTETNRIVLTLQNDGSALLTDKTNTIFNKNGLAMAKGNETELTYYKQSIAKIHEHGYHTLTVPKGKKYKVTLSDGTKIFCDSGTRLKYPVDHNGATERYVELEGQAYFEVTQNKEVPFTVLTPAMKIEVLGTHLNVNAYPESTTKVVLVEGTVVAYNSLQQDSLQLKPNELLEINDNNGFTKTTVEVADHIAWRYGKLVFEEVPFSTILETFERKYAVSITNSNLELDKQQFTAKFESETIDQAIEAFQAEAGFAYEVTDNGIHIK